MNNIGNNDDPDQMARRQAALAAQARARQVAGNIAAAHAAGVYNQARQNAVGYNPAQPGIVLVKHNMKAYSIALYAAQIHS